MVATLSYVKENRRYLLAKALPYMIALGLIVMFVMTTFVFAESVGDGNGAANSNAGANAAITAVVRIIRVLLSALGALFIVLGVIKFTMVFALAAGGTIFLYRKYKKLDNDIKGK